MDVIVGHENLDFDALGSMVLARYLHPGARLVRLGGLEGRVREVARLFADHLALLDEDEVDPDEVERVIVCDTARPERIGPFKALVGKVPFVVYDHHPRAPGDLPASGGAVRPFGATVTVIAEILRARGIAPTPATPPSPMRGCGRTPAVSPTPERPPPISRWAPGCSSTAPALRPCATGCAATPTPWPARCSRT